jgi:hypothetical protein
LLLGFLLVASIHGPQFAPWKDLHETAVSPYPHRGHRSGTTPPPPPPPTTNSPGGGNPGTPGSKIPAAPYLYLGWGNPPSATSVMQQTGIKAFTMAFMLSSGGCNPAWDGNRPLTGGVDQQTINAIRGAGGDIEIWYGAGSSTR